MAVHDGTAIMDRLAKMEANLVLHQNKVADRAKEDLDKLLSSTSLLIQKMDTSYSALVKHNTDIVEKMMGIKVQQEVAKGQLVKVEDRLINTKSVQIGLMEARMVVNTHEAMMQIGGAVHQLGKDVLNEFRVMKARFMMLQSTMEVGLDVQEEFKKEPKKKNRKRANPKKAVAKEAKVTKEVSTKVIKGSKSNKPKIVKKKPNNSTNMSNSDEEVTYLGSANNSLGKESVNSSLEKENAVRSLMNEKEESVPGFDSDFLDLMRDANIVPEEHEGEVPAKIVKIEDIGDDNIADAALDNIGFTNVQSQSEVVESVTVKTESININDVRSEDDLAIVKVELDDEDDLMDIRNNNGIDILVEKNHEIVAKSPAKIMRAVRDTPVGIRCKIVPNPKRILPPMCPQVSSKLSSMSSLKRRHSTSSLGAPSRHLPIVPVVNRMLPPQSRRDSQPDPDISSSSGGVSQAQAIGNKTPADGKVINIVFSCGFCGEDSFSKHDLEEHIAANHRNHFLQ